MNIEKNIHIKSLTLKINPLFFVPLLFIVFTSGSLYFSIVLFCALFHELGHLLAINLSSCTIRSISLLPFGVDISYKGNTDYRHDLFIALLGPVFNFLLCAVFWMLSVLFPAPFLCLGFYCSMFLGITNLVPLKGFDGARILESLSFCFFEYEKALKFTSVSELLSLIILLIFSLFTLSFCSFNLSVFAICIYILVTAYPINNRSFFKA